MRCKNHPCDLSSAAGVCASCLRERLLAIIAAQTQAQAHLHQQPRQEKTRFHDPPPPPLPLAFPRSVSPYVTHRKSDEAASASASCSHHLRFYSTPQAGPTYHTTSSSFASGTTTTTFPTPARKKKHRTLSLLSNLFRSKSDKYNLDPAASAHGDSTHPSPSWFSTILVGRQKKPTKSLSMDYSSHIGHKPRRVVDRGMSPVRGPDSDENCEDCDGSPSGSGHSSDSTPGWKRTPVNPAVARRGKQGHGRNVSSLTFCLSPMVRTSPNRRWNQKGGLPADMGLVGEIRAPGKPHLSSAASFCANRSRKLADFGRVHHNRFLSSTRQQINLAFKPLDWAEPLYLSGGEFQIGHTDVQCSSECIKLHNISIRVHEIHLLCYPHCQKVSVDS